MSASPRDITELKAAFEAAAGESEGDPGPALLARARDSVVRVVSTHPRASLVGAFAVGFLLARLVRRLGEELS